MEIDFSTLATAVAAWQEDFIRHVHDTQGEAQARAVEADLKGDPWLALQWYVEEVRRAG
ncbi:MULTISPECIES: hypothetical protein [unclassified Mesorhizobium]|uniref:hypothetical protein n=1 Tax=unclassified Mesorhizobium TaxID=325217 RepID=UPI00142EA568|nr:MULTISPECIES: hypothetical protein [unclassified Mesorhizobium]